MNRNLTLLLMVILCFSLDLIAQEQLEGRSLQLCAVDLPVQQDKESPLVFKNMLFFSEPYQSNGNLEIINQGEKEVKYYLIVADVLDRDGNYLLSVPILNEDRKRKIPFDVSFTSWLEASAVDYFEPIGAGEEANKPFFSQFGVIDCPASARISLLKLQYSDGTTFSAASLRYMFHQYSQIWFSIDLRGLKHGEAPLLTGLLRLMVKAVPA